MRVQSKTNWNCAQHVLLGQLRHNAIHCGLERPWRPERHYDVTITAAQRPLNVYAGSPQVFQCPADVGDNFAAHPTSNGTNCWNAFGTSYLAQIVDDFGVKRVFGALKYTPFFPQPIYDTTVRPMKLPEITIAPTTKIIQGDWTWHPNRGVTEIRSIWHNYKGKGLTILLWGDGHVAPFALPLDTDIAMLASTTNTWW